MSEIIDQPDIGKCDDCGDEDSRRHRTVVNVTISGVPERVVAWLCAPCRLRRRTSA